MGFFDPKCKACGRRFKKSELINGICSSCNACSSCEINSTGINLGSSITELLGKPLDQMSDHEITEKNEELWKYKNSTPPELPSKLGDNVTLNINGEDLECTVEAISPNSCLFILEGRNYKTYASFLVVASKNKVLFHQQLHDNIERAAIADSGIFSICEETYDESVRNIVNTLKVFNEGFESLQLYVFEYVSDSLELLDNGAVVCLKAMRETRFYETHTGELLPESLLNEDDETEEEGYINPLDSFGTSILDIDLNSVNCDSYDIYFKVNAETESNLDSLTKEAASRYINKLSNCFTPDFNGYLCALAYRRLGELHLIVDNKSEAVNAFRLALKLDPKVGVKRKLTSLEKMLDSKQTKI